jgi:hypothetical protein
VPSCVVGTAHAVRHAPSANADRNAVEGVIGDSGDWAEERRRFRT